MPTTNTANLASLAQQVLSECLCDHRGRLTIEVEIDSSYPVPGPIEAVREALNCLVQQALSEMDEGELSLIAWQGDSHLELEIADTGRPCEQRSVILPLAVARLGCQLIRQNVPQGGTAVTLRFPLARLTAEAA